MLLWAWILWNNQSTWAFVWFNCSARKRVESPIPPPATKTFKMATKNLQLFLKTLSSACQRSPYPIVWFKVFSSCIQIVVEVLQCKRGTHHKRALTDKCKQLEHNLSKTFLNRPPACFHRCSVTFPSEDTSVESLGRAVPCIGVILDPMRLRHRVGGDASKIVSSFHTQHQGC